MKQMRIAFVVLALLSVPILYVTSQSQETAPTICQIWIEWLSVEGETRVPDGNEDGQSWFYSLGFFESEIVEFDDKTQAISTIGPDRVSPLLTSLSFDRKYSIDIDEAARRVYAASYLNQVEPIRLWMVARTIVNYDKLRSNRSETADDLEVRVQTEIDDFQISCADGESIETYEFGGGFMAAQEHTFTYRIDVKLMQLK